MDAVLRTNNYSTVMVWAGQVIYSQLEKVKLREWVTYSSSSRTLVCSARDWSDTTVDPRLSEPYLSHAYPNPWP